MSASTKVKHKQKIFDGLANAPMLMGILNITPDSFSDGGQHNSAVAALNRGKSMVADGCHVLDIGGESTRPGATPVTAKEELERIIPVVKLLHKKLDTPLSIDSYKASVARAGIENGAVMINDIWGLQGDPEMADSVKQTGSLIIAMHNRKNIDAEIDIIEDIKSFFDKSLKIAATAGIADDHIMLDPGIGFGKTHLQDLITIARLSELLVFGKKIMIGASRKSFIGHVLGAEVDNRLRGTVAANMISVRKGASILRIHDIEEHVHSLKMQKAIRSYEIN